MTKICKIGRSKIVGREGEGKEEEEKIRNL